MTPPPSRDETMPTGAQPTRTLAVVHGAPATVESAVARLALSRASLRAAMLPKPRVPDSSGFFGQGAAGWTEGIAERLRNLPGAGAIVETIQSWWDRHPFRPIGHIAAASARRLAGPVAERSPLKLVFAAAAIGALLAVLRPWRWMLRSAIFAGLVPALAMRAMRELPLDTLFDAFSSTFKGEAKADRVPAGQVPATPNLAPSVASASRTAAPKRTDTLVS